MKHLVLLTLLSLLCTGNGQNTTETDSTTDITTPVQTDTTPSSTVTSPYTTTDVPTTTVITSTTTQSPTPTTTSSSTSSAPTTITPTTSTKAPAPPKVETGSFNVTDPNNGVICIRADLRIRFKIPVNNRDEYIVVMPHVTTEGSTCNGTNNTQVMRLTGDEYILLLTFAKEEKNAYLKKITLDYQLPDQADVAYNDKKLYEVSVGNSYMCNSLENVPLVVNVTMEVFQIHIQAFGVTKNAGFGNAQECEADNKVDDVVPIAVGCALLGLVIIVLIAYFVGRRRSRQKGYQSV